MRTLMALGLGLMLVAGVATGGDAKKDAEQLQGKWVGEAKGFGATVELTITKGEFTFKFGDKLSKGTVKLDPSKKPKEIDLAITESEQFKGKTSYGIYELQGDTLKWCSRNPGVEMRPTSFKDTDVLFVEFKRVK